MSVADRSGNETAPETVRSVSEAVSRLNAGLVRAPADREGRELAPGLHAARSGPICSRATRRRSVLALELAFDYMSMA